MHVIDAAMTSHVLPSNDDPRKIGLDCIANEVGGIVSERKLSAEYAKKSEQKKAHGVGRLEGFDVRKWEGFKVLRWEGIVAKSLGQKPSKGAHD